MIAATSSDPPAPGAPLFKGGYDARYTKKKNNDFNNAFWHFLHGMNNKMNNVRDGIVTAVNSTAQIMKLVRYVFVWIMLYFHWITSFSGKKNV